VSCKTAKLTLAYFYVVLIADTPNLNGSDLELPRQLEGFTASQFFHTIDFLGLLKNSTD
jgi:hypothetical protein